MSSFFDSDDKDLQDDKVSEGMASNLRKVILVVVPLIIFVFGSYMFYQFLTNQRDSLLVERKVIEQVTSGKSLAKVELAPMIANLSSAGKQASKVIKMTVALEIEASDDKEVRLVESRSAEVQDIFQIFLRDLRPSDLNGAEGTMRLKEELIKRSGKVLSPVVVTNVLFKEILIEG